MGSNPVCALAPELLTSVIHCLYLTVFCGCQDFLQFATILLPSGHIYGYLIYLRQKEAGVENPELLQEGSPQTQVAPDVCVPGGKAYLVSSILLFLLLLGVIVTTLLIQGGKDPTAGASLEAFSSMVTS